MRLFDRTSVPVSAEERISVSLKTLMQLAKYAPGIKLRNFTPLAAQTGNYVARFKGRGMEFDETRLYFPGDDIRSIDWKVTARTGSAHTKLYREERERPVFIAVDLRPAMQFATRGVFKSVQAIKLAALLAWSAQQQGDRIGGQVFSASECQELKPQGGRQAVLRLFDTLLQPHPSASLQTPSFPHVLQRLMQHVRPGSRVFIISDFRGMYLQAEHYFSTMARHCDVTLILIYDPLENTLPAGGRYRFADERNELEIDTGDAERVKKYQQRFQRHVANLEALAKKMHMTLLRCSTVDDAVQVLR